MDGLLTCRIEALNISWGQRQRNTGWSRDGTTCRFPNRSYGKEGGSWEAGRIWVKRTSWIGLPSSLLKSTEVNAIIGFWRDLTFPPDAGWLIHSAVRHSAMFFQINIVHPMFVAGHISSNHFQQTLQLSFSRSLFRIQKVIQNFCDSWESVSSAKTPTVPMSMPFVSSPFIIGWLTLSCWLYSWHSSVSGLLLLLSPALHVSL